MRLEMLGTIAWAIELLVTLGDRAGISLGQFALLTSSHGSLDGIFIIHVCHGTLHRGRHIFKWLVVSQGYKGVLGAVTQLGRAACLSHAVSEF